MLSRGVFSVFVTVNFVGVSITIMSKLYEDYVHSWRLSAAILGVSTVLVVLW